MSRTYRLPAVLTGLACALLALGAARPAALASSSMVPGSGGGAAEACALRSGPHRQCGRHDRLADHADRPGRRLVRCSRRGVPRPGAGAAGADGSHLSRSREACRALACWWPVRQGA
jgi:hypothetical protein